MLFRTILATLIITAFGFSSLGSAPALAQPVAAATVTGLATDGQGNGLGGVTITLTGPGTYVTTTKTDGTFEIDNVKPGLYTATATLGGYNSAAQDNYAVVAGTTQTLSVSLIQQTLTSLQEIGRVRVNASTSAFNTTSSALIVVPQAKFTEQGALGLARVLEEQPGFTLQTSGAAGNTAGRASYQVPAFRDGFVTETEDLLDGHSVGAGDNGATTLTTFLSPYILGGVELIAGPGATAPDIFSAINGTINFHTLDPTTRPLGSITYGVDGYGGQFSNFRLSGTTLHGKLGYVFDYVIDGSPGPLHTTNEPITIAAANTTINGKTFTATTATAFTNNIENNPPPSTSTLLECCYPISTQFLNRNTLAKLVYHFSPNTSLSGSFIDDALTASAIGNEYDSYSTMFTPGAAYVPSTTGYQPGQILVTGQQLAAAPVVPGAYLNRIQPNYQTEFRTGNSTNTFLARYWQAQYEFFITQGQSTETPGQPYTTTLNLSGTANVGGVSTAFNNTPATLVISPTNPVCAGSQPGTYVGIAPAGVAGTCTAATATNYATQAYPFTTQFDHMHGGGFEYDHFFPNTDYLTVSYDQTQHAGYLTGYIPPVVPSVPDGAWLNTNTLLVRGVLNFSKLNVTLSNYYDYYKERYSTNAGIPVPIPGCTITTTGCSATVPGAGLFSVYNQNLTFQQNFVGHDDPRIGLTYRADPNLSIRFATGSSLVPVYLSAINVTNTLPTAAATGFNFTNTQANTGLLPETAWGYDLGADWRLGDGQTIVSTELYQSNLRNQLFASQGISCYTPATGVITSFGTGCTGPAPPALCTASALTTSCPLYTSENVNFGTTRYQGVQVSITRDPHVGFGFTINASLMRGYPYNVNPCFYYTAPNATCTGTLGATGAAIPVPTNTTAIGIIPGNNFGALGSAGIAGSPLTGMFTSAAAGAVPGPGAASGGDLGGFPYSTGFLDLHFRSPRGGLIQLTSTYFGPNNGYDMPAFFRYDANVIFPVYDRNTTLALNIVNIGNIDNGSQIGEFEGTTIPLLNNRYGLSNLYPLGPRRVQLSLTHNFDFGIH
jgi:hypothetical protein